MTRRLRSQWNDISCYHFDVWSGNFRLTGVYCCNTMTSFSTTLDSTGRSEIGLLFFQAREKMDDSNGRFMILVMIGNV